MTSEIFHEYAELKIQEREISEKIDALKGQVIEAMQAEGIDKQPTDLGTFTVQRSKKWSFSDEVVAAEKKVKSLKESEKADGTASFEEVPELKFYHIKTTENL